MKHRYVRVGEVRLHVAEAGQGPPLLLLHGWPQHWWCWRRLIGPLARSRRVLAPDLRGFGWSDAPPGDYSTRTLAADVLALLDAEGLERVEVVGHDWGGFVAFLLALEHPERFERLVALDIMPPWSRSVRPQARHLALPLLGSYQLLLAMPFLGRATLTSGVPLVRAILSAGSGPEMHWSDDEVEAYAGVLRDPDRALASSARYRSFLTRDLPRIATGRDRSDRLAVPSLLLMGAASPLDRVLRPAPGPNLRVERIAGAGHFLPEEAPDVVRRAISSPP